jgi:HEAT repeat protein
MRARSRWLRGPLATSVAFAAALGSGAWAWRAALEDYPVLERAGRVRTGDRDERIGALLELTLLVLSDRSHAHAAIPVAVAATRDRDPLVRAQALISLGDMTPGSDRELVAMARRILSDRLTDPSPQVRHAAAGALGRLGLERAAVRNTLLDLARGSEDLTTRVVALQGLGSMEGADQEVHMVARDALRDRDPSVRAMAVVTLGSWLGERPELADLVFLCLEDGAPGVRMAACQTLRQYAKPPLALLPRLVSLLAHHDDLVSTSAAEALGNMGSEARSAAPELWRSRLKEVAAKGGQTSWQSAYVSAIARVAPEGPEAREAIGSLVAMMRDGRPELRPYAAIAISDFGAHAIAALPELREAGGSGDARLRRAAQMSISRIEAARPRDGTEGQ